HVLRRIIYTILTIRYVLYCCFLRSIPKHKLLVQTDGTSSHAIGPAARLVGPERHSINPDLEGRNVGFLRNYPRDCCHRSYLVDYSTPYIFLLSLLLS
ncbi:hypothetical protein T310_8644, partial [Rasamsonia emersonii CBS 393.64]